MKTCNSVALKHCSVQNKLKSDVASLTTRGTQRKYSWKPLKHNIVKVSVKENEVPTEKNYGRGSIFATKASYISN